MNREILFRAWHKDSKVMFDVLAIAFHMNKVVVKWHGAERDIAINQFEIMQFTGLHDKNGTAIFESDVVKSYLIDDGDSIDTVIFDWGAFMLSNPNKLQYPIGHYDKQYLEVIGDIFSNHELLTQ